MWLDYAERYDKVMYGTDWPLINVKSYLDVMKAVIPAARHEDVFYNNALRCYKKIEGLL